jgi:class 3 adenylate cyclase
MAPPDADGTRSARRLVSIVFADLVGSTGLAERLDPESMHDLLDRYSDVCSAVIERMGGTVEGFIGDAVVGIFGLAELHEDDALRAVRAAVELRAAGAALSAELERERGVEIAMKFGVESGEVFVSAGARRSSFGAGDAFNVAARLEGTAPKGEILLGENVYNLVRGVHLGRPGHRDDIGRLRRAATRSTRRRATKGLWVGAPPLGGENLVVGALTLTRRLVRLAVPFSDLLLDVVERVVGRGPSRSWPIGQFAHCCTPQRSVDGLPQENAGAQHPEVELLPAV